MEEKPVEENSKSNAVDTSAQVTTKATETVKLTQIILDELIEGVKLEFEKSDKKLELAILNQQFKYEGSEVIIEVVGHLQEERAIKMIPDMVKFFREVGKVQDISFRVEVREEVEESANRMYTNSEKFEFLKKKHGALGEFQRKFGLDTDF
ncbi:hypothetical protein [Algoriphagus namhaensis]